jgi:hypothetical protein
LSKLLPRISTVAIATVLACAQAVAEGTPSVCLHVATLANEGGLPRAMAQSGSLAGVSTELELCVDLNGDGRKDCVAEDGDGGLAVFREDDFSYATLDPSERWRREEIASATNRSFISQGGKHYLLNSIGELPSYLSTLGGDGILSILCEFERRDGRVRALPPYEILVRSAGNADDVWETALMRPGTDSAELLLANGHTLPDHIGMMPSLAWAITHKRADAIEWLLVHGAAVNAQHPSDMPLVRAVWVEDLALAARLIQHGADPSPLIGQINTLASLPPEGTRPLIVAAVTKFGQIPESIVRHAIKRDPPLLDDLIKSKLKVQSNSRGWQAGKLMVVPFDVQADAYLSRSRVMNRKLERWYDSGSVPSPAGLTLMMFGSFDRGLVIWRWRSISDEEFQNFATSVCLYFSEADCGPQRQRHAARAWAEQLSHGCPDELRNELTLAACNVLQYYKSVRYGSPISVIDAKALRSTAGALSNQLTPEDLMDRYSGVR